MSDLGPTGFIQSWLIPSIFCWKYFLCRMYRQKHSEKSRHFQAKHVLILLHLEDITEQQWNEWRLQLARHTLWLRLMGFFSRLEKSMAHSSLSECAICHVERMQQWCSAFPRFIRTSHLPYRSKGHCMTELSVWTNYTLKS